MIKLRVVYVNGERKEFICNYISVYPNSSTLSSAVLYLELTDESVRHIDLADVDNFSTIRD